MQNLQPTKSFTANRITFGGDTIAIERTVPVETPLQIIYGEIPYAVMMVTPADVEDFIAGFSLTEGVITQASDIRKIDIAKVEGGLQAKVWLTPHCMSQHLSRKRQMTGRTSCGVCGIDDLAHIKTASKSVGLNTPIALSSVEQAILQLEHHQPLNDATRAVHVASWFDRQGAYVASREDVGRHNALDKLIGCLLCMSANPAEGFILISSRCSFEMVEKAACFGASHLVAISAPTSLALERAAILGVTIIAVARKDGAILFDPCQRVTDNNFVEFQI